MERYSVGWPDPTPTQPQMDPAPASSCSQRSGVSSSPRNEAPVPSELTYVQGRQKPVSRRDLFLPICPPHPFKRVNLRRTQVGSSSSPEREVVIFHIWFFQKERFLVVLGKKAGFLHTHTTNALTKPPFVRLLQVQAPVVSLAPLWREPMLVTASVVRQRPGTARGSRAKARPHSKDKPVPWTLIRSRATGGRVL